MKHRVGENYFEELDFCRAIAALSVLAIHVTSLPLAALNPSGTSFQIFFALNKALQFSVPLFMIMSALLEGYYYNKTIQSHNRFDWKRFYQKKLARVVLPYLGWSVLYLIFYTFFFRLYSVKQIFTPASLLHFFVFGKSSYHLYFMVILIQFYLVFPLLVLFYKVPEKYRTLLIPLLYVLQTFFVMYAGAKIYGIFPDIVTTYLWYFFPFTVALIVGFTYPNHLFVGKRSIFIFGFVSFIFGIFYVSISFQLNSGNHLLSYLYLPVWYLYTFAISLFFINLCRLFRGSDNAFLKGLKVIGKYSYGIYFIHPMILFLFEKIFVRFSNLSTGIYALGIIIIFCGVLLVSLTLSYLFRTLVKHKAIKQKKS